VENRIDEGKYNNELRHALFTLISPSLKKVRSSKRNSNAVLITFRILLANKIERLCLFGLLNINTVTLNLNLIKIFI